MSKDIVGLIAEISHRDCKNNSCLLEQYRKLMLNRKCNTYYTEKKCPSCNFIFVTNGCFGSPFTKVCIICQVSFCQYICNIHEKYHNCAKDHTKEITLCYNIQGQYSHEKFKSIVCNDCYSKINEYNHLCEGRDNDDCKELNYRKICDSIN